MQSGSARLASTFSRYAADAADGMASWSPGKGLPEMMLKSDQYRFPCCRNPQIAVPFLQTSHRRNQRGRSLRDAQIRVDAGTAWPRKISRSGFRH